MIALFDVDKTLLKGYSGFYTTLTLIRHGVMKKRRILEALYYRLIGPFYEGGEHELLRKMYGIAIRDMAGSHLDDILAIGRECFERSIKPRLYAGVVEKVREHQALGHPVYLITSGPYMVIRILAEFLGAKDFYCAGPEIDAQGVLTDRLRLPIYYREGKIAAAEDILRREGASWADCIFYSDSIDDRFLLEKVGHPHLVNPDRRIEKLGLSRCWPILKFTEVLNREKPSRGQGPKRSSTPSGGCET